MDEQNSNMQNQASLTEPTANTDSRKMEFSPNFWHGCLLILFLISSVCGIYLTVKPGMKCEASSGQEKKISSSLVSSLSSKEDKPSVAWIKVRGVIATDNSSSPFSRPQGGYIAFKILSEPCWIGISR